MSAALWVFQLSVQSVRQLQQHTIEVSFEMTGLPYHWTPVANHSILKQGSLQLGNIGWFWRMRRSIASHMIIQSGDLNISEVILKSESQFNYLFTLKNVHLRSNSYNCWMQPNIAMKFTEYVVWIHLCRLCKFGEKNYYDSRDVEFFLVGYFFDTLCIYDSSLLHRVVNSYSKSAAGMEVLSDGCQCLYTLSSDKIDRYDLRGEALHTVVFEKSWHVDASPGEPVELKAVYMLLSGLCCQSLQGVVRSRRRRGYS